VLRLVFGLAPLVLVSAALVGNRSGAATAWRPPQTTPDVLGAAA